MRREEAGDSKFGTRKRSVACTIAVPCCVRCTYPSACLGASPAGAMPHLGDARRLMSSHSREILDGDLPCPTSHGHARDVTMSTLPTRLCGVVPLKVV